MEGLIKEALSTRLGRRDRVVALERELLGAIKVGARERDHPVAWHRALRAPPPQSHSNANARNERERE